MPETRMSKSTVPVTAGELAVFKVFIKGPIEAVWREITKTDSVQECFFNMRLHTPELSPGRPFQMRTKSGKCVGVVGEILECEPPRRFVTTFRFTQHDDPACKITYELKEVVGGTEFLMTFDDLPTGTATAKQMRQGGTMITNTLKSLVETGKPPYGVRVLYGVVFPLAQLLTPKKCRVENWPMS